MKTTNHFTDLEHLELVARRIADSGADITREYADWISVTFGCASLGEGARESYHLICSQYAGYKREECDKCFDNCMHTGRGDITLGTVLKLAQDAGIDTSLPRGRRPKSAKQSQEEKKAELTAIKEQLQTNRQWRHNVLSNKTEYSDGGSAWMEVDDRFIDTILTRLREAGLRVKDNELRSLVNSSDFAPDFAPHLEWLSGLKPWNPDTDPDYIHDFFISHMEFGPMADVELYDLAFHRWLVAVVALWREEIDANPLMPTFCGIQQIGKSFIAQNILPPCLQKYQTAVRPNDPINTDTMLTLSEVLMVVFDEIAINSDTKSNMMKFLITSGQTNLRDAYGHYRKSRRRMASAIATTNYHQFIRESEGSRRYLGIDLTGTKNIYDYPLPYEGAYAQAVYLLEHGFAPKPTFDESRRISEHNRQYMIPNDCEEALLTFVRRPEDGLNVEACTAGDLLNELNVRGFRGAAYNAVNIGKAMKALGFEARKTNRGRTYNIVIADYERQKKERMTNAITRPEQPEVKPDPLTDEVETTDSEPELPF